MEIKDLIEITPEIKKEAYNLLKASEKLHELLKEQGAGQFDMSIYNTSANKLTIYDRYEYSEDGEGTTLGFYVHKFHPDGSYILDFINEDNEEARAFDEAFNKAWEAENGANE